MILLIDNYDSFVYNLARYFGQLGLERTVVRNDAISLDEIEAMAPSYIVISPGPCTPNEAGVSVALVKRFGASIPILGICLGHQAIAQAYGGNIIRAKLPMHGKSSVIQHDHSSLFHGISESLSVGRYHSLAIERETLPSCLEITAQAKNSEIMAIKHRHFPVFGVQFHPESILTEHGYQLLKNFIGVSSSHHAGIAGK